MRRSAGIIAIAAGVAVAVGVGTVLATDMVGRESGPPVVLPTGGSLSVLEQTAGPQDVLPDFLVRYARESEEPDLASVRWVMRSNNATLYGFKSKVPGRFCGLAVSEFPAGHLANVTCGRLEDVGTGLFTASVQNRFGGQGTPTTTFGFVPDGIASVEVEGRSLVVTRNAFAVDTTSDQAWLATATFIDVAGQRVTVETPSTP